MNPPKLQPPVAVLKLHTGQRYSSLQGERDFCACGYWCVRRRMAPSARTTSANWSSGVRLSTSRSRRCSRTSRTTYRVATMAAGTAPDMASSPRIPTEALLGIWIDRRPARQKGGPVANEAWAQCARADTRLPQGCRVGGDQEDRSHPGFRPQATCPARSIEK